MRFVWILLIVCSAVYGEDWPQWRGPERSSISQETGLAKQWPKDGPRLLWYVGDIGDGYATPSVVGNRIYVLANRGMEDEYVQALSADDGTVVWRTHIGNVGNPDQQPSYPMARSTPTVDGDMLYALSSDGDLVAVQTATGEILWRRSLRRDLGGVPGKWAYAESPLVDGDVLVVAPGGPVAAVVALNKTDGKVAWRSHVPGGDAAAYASAIIVHAAGRKQYVEFLDKGVVGIDAKTGEFLWRYAGTASGPANVTTPIARGSLVYSTNSRRFGAGLVELKANGGGVLAEQRYFSRGAPNTMGGQVLLEGVLYGTNNDGLVAANFETGELLWQETAGGPGSLMYADGRLYVHYESGDVSLVEATREAYRERGRFAPPNQPAHPRGGREMAWAYPVVANGRLYIRDLGTLWCYDVSAP